MPFHPGDYHADTAHLRTAAEHGAYMLLLMNYWQSGRALPSDDRKLAAIARVTPSEWAEMRDTICEFFQERDGLLYHKRVDQEIERARAKSEKARESGLRSANARRPSSERSTNVEPALNECPTNQDQDQVKEEANASSSRDDDAVPSGEVRRRLEEATGWLDLPGIKTIEALISGGVSFEGRILPLARDESERRSQKPKSWAYLAAVVKDTTRNPTPTATPVETAWVPVGSPAWLALTRVKRESWLRSMLKPGPGGEGISWPVRDLPPAQGAAA